MKTIILAMSFVLWLTDDQPKVKPEIKVISVDVSRDFMPPRVGSSPVMAAVRVRGDIRSIKWIKLTNKDNRETWVGELKFVYHLENKNPERGSLYGTVSTKKDDPKSPRPIWAVGSEIQVEIGLVLDKKRTWVNGGVTKVKATH